jgi:DNA invertase Pin-like site-specific DNA recombinase
MGNLVDEYFQEKLLISVTDQIDTSTASGRLMLNILTTLAQWERETIGERTSGALQHMKAEGVQLGSAALGWRHGGEVDCDGRRVIVEDEDELMAVARVLELKSNGFSLRGIAESLTRDGYPTKRGGQWAAETVSKILRREAQAARRECLTIQDGGHAA